MRRFLDFEGDNPAIVANNFDWMREFSFLDFLRDVGKNFPVNVMMAKDSIRSRLEGESGISYTEFSYMLLQAWDFVYLNRQFGCELQVGGSDQWGNITAGIDLARRMDGRQLFGLTNPLLTRSDGSKMGKTESGAIWISAKRTSPYQLYQYWINTGDDDVSKCLRFLTDLTEEEVTSLDAARQAAAHEKASQTRLAEEVTRMVHGESGLSRAQKASQVLFGGEIDSVTDSELTEIFADVPSCAIPPSSLEGEGMSLLDAFVACGLAKSRGEARRTLEQGGAYVNNRRIEDASYLLTSRDLAGETTIVLRSGRKKYALLKIA
jgi:tyrosyl-tRNA synthetase